MGVFWMGVLYMNFKQIAIRKICLHMFFCYRNRIYIWIQADIEMLIFLENKNVVELLSSQE